MFLVCFIMKLRKQTFIEGHTLLKHVFIFIFLVNTAEHVERLGFQTSLIVRTSATLCKRVLKGSKVGYGGTYTCESDQWLTVLPMGFCDGYHRSLSNKGKVVREKTGTYL